MASSELGFNLKSALASSDFGFSLKSAMTSSELGFSFEVKAPTDVHRFYDDYSQIVGCLYYQYCLPFHRFLKLDNDLKVLLVSDVCTEKAAASLAVRVGELWLGGYLSCHVWLTIFG